MNAGTIQLPLYRGKMKGTDKAVWYILTDTSDKTQAEALGLNHSAKLQFAATCRGARDATFGTDGVLVFDQGTVDFTPVHSVTFAPALQNTRVGGDDGAFSAVERIFSFVNGPANLDGKGVNPQRQGLSSALRGEGSPLNVLGGIPHVATNYSPLWDFNLGEWTAPAIARGYRSRLNEEFQILGFVQRGFVTGPGGAKWGSTGIIVNCPIVHRFL